MGSEFAYEDIAKKSYKKFTFEEGTAKKANLDGLECFTGVRIPKDKNSGYSKQIGWVDSKDFLLRKVEYYDRKNELLKTAIYSDYKKINGIWSVGKITMKNHQNDKKTILIWSDIEIFIGLKDKDFTKKVLKN